MGEKQKAAFLKKNVRNWSFFSSVYQPHAVWTGHVTRTCNTYLTWKITEKITLIDIFPRRINTEGVQKKKRKIFNGKFCSKSNWILYCRTNSLMFPLTSVLEVNGCTTQSAPPTTNSMAEFGTDQSLPKWTGSVEVASWKRVNISERVVIRKKGIHYGVCINYIFALKLVIADIKNISVRSHPMRSARSDKLQPEEG